MRQIENGISFTKSWKGLRYLLACCKILDVFKNNLLTTIVVITVMSTYQYRAKLLRADWLRERAFFVNQGHFW